MTTRKYPCIICENGDPYSNVICNQCEESIEHIKEVYESMVALVHDLNDICGSVPLELSKEIKDKVKPLHEMLYQIKIKDTRKKYDHT